MKNLKNIGLGLATLFFAFSVVFSMSSFKGEEKKSSDILVQETPGRWIFVDSNDEDELWHCINGETTCKGSLKENAQPNPDGSYPSSEVDYVIDNTMFEYL